MGLLNHQALQIIKGLPPVPSDTLSAEQPVINIDLLASGVGYSLVNWSPNIPSLKSGGVWADSALTDGRSLVAGVNTNVIETMTLQLTGATCTAFAAQFATLGRMIRDMRAFHDTQWQIEPIYLKWWAKGAPGPQYALIYNIDTKITYQDAPTAQAELIVSIERESYWRAIAPGDNPKRWAIENRSEVFNTSNSSLIGASSAINTGDLVDQQITNKIEFSTATAIAVRNFVDIPANSIPGDVPALVCVTVQQTSVDNLPDVYIARTSRPTSLPDRAGGSNLPLYNDLACAFATMNSADTTLQTDANGIVYTPVSANARCARISFATTTALVVRLSWNANVHRAFAVLRGRYMIFLRARQNAGAAGNTAIRLDFEDNAANGTVFYSSPTITPIVSASVELHYGGIVTIPPDNKTLVAARGTGVYAANAANYGSQFVVKLYASRATGAATLDIFDLILVPIDEGIAFIQEQNSTGFAGLGNHMIFDNTGYFSHGEIVDSGFGRYTGGSTTNDELIACEFRGYGMSLEPKVNNRLYFLLQRPSDSTVLPGNVAYIGVNIVPRWIGIRDA